MTLLDTIIDKAKASLLAQGALIPMVYVEYAGKEIALNICTGVPPEMLKQRLYFFQAGRDLGRAAPHRKVATLVLVSMAFMYTLDYDAPEATPTPKETLTIHQLTPARRFRKPVQSTHIYEILRSGEEGRTLDLVPIEHDQAQVYSPLLSDFLTGIQSARMTDEEFARFLEQVPK